MVIQRRYENWSGACYDRVKTHSDGLNAPWNLFPAPTPYLWHSKMQTKIHCIVPESLHTLTHSHTHFSICSRSVWLPTFKIQYLIAVPPLLIGICLKFEHSDAAIIQESWVQCINVQNISTKMRWIQVKAIVPYWLLLQNLYLSQKRSGRVRFLNCTKEAATQYHVSNFFLHIQCISVHLYPRPHFTSPILSHNKVSPFWILPIESARADLSDIYLSLQPYIWVWEPSRSGKYPGRGSGTATLQRRLVFRVAASKVEAA